MTDRDDNLRIKSITLGCRFNFYESEVAKSMVRKIDPDSDVIIINTCCVTHEAERQSKQVVRKAIRENPDAKIIVTGCAAKTSSEYFNNLEGVFKVIQNDKKDDINSYASISEADKIYDFDDSLVEESDPLFLGKARVFLQIQNGCDHFCSYCIIPFTRGSSKSLPIETILGRVGYFVDHGFKEIVLSGIDITSYGKDLDNIEFADVLSEILRKYPTMERIRISSIDPDGVSDRLFDIITNEQRIMPHFHLSIQSGDNHVLKAMRRRHTREDVIDLCDRIRKVRDDVIFGSDFITGFPTETEEMFQNTMKIVDEAGISLLHVFPYSKRSGTLASTFMELPKNIVVDRAQRLREKSDKVRHKLYESFMGKKVNMIVEKIHDGFSSGKTDHFIPIKIKGEYEVSDILKDIQIKSFDDEFLYNY